MDYESVYTNFMDVIVNIFNEINYLSDLKNTIGEANGKGVQLGNVDSMIEKQLAFYNKIINSVEKDVYIELHKILSFSIYCFAKITILIKPILPSIVSEIESRIFDLPKPWSWGDLDKLDIKNINSSEHLISRIEEKDLKKLIERVENV